MIDSGTFDKWPGAGYYGLSADGKFAVFDSSDIGSEHVAFGMSMDKKWRRIFGNIKEGGFLQSKDYFVFLNRGDSICIVKLGTDKVEYLERVGYFRTLSGNGGEWLAYTKTTTPEHPIFVIRDIKTGREQVTDSVINYWFNATASIIVLQRHINRNNRIENACEWIDLANNKHLTIWEGEDFDEPAFDRSGHRLAFISRETSSLSRNLLWYYKEDMTQAKEVLINGQAADSNLTLASQGLQFSGDGQRLFFTLTEKDLPSEPGGGVQVDLWSYRDVALQEQALSNARSLKSYLGYVDIGSGNTLQLGHPGSRIYILHAQGRNQYAVSIEGDLDDSWWRAASQPTFCLVSLTDGHRTPLKGKIFTGRWWNLINEPELSPEEQYVLYIDPITGNYYSYEIASGITRNMTSTAVDVKRVAGWFARDKAVLVYDKWDIWRLDPRGIEKPVNLTNNYGGKHHIQFHLSSEEEITRHLPEDTALLLTAFDTATKYSGFYRMHLGKMQDPEYLTMGPYRYGAPRKATHANQWIVDRQSATESMNLYATSDFKKFTPMTYVAPEKNYNWLQAELVTWRLPAGDSCQGMLFKPENFDPNRHYPMLVNYYRQQSHELYEYRIPEVTRDVINIPYFVSRGYIVFIPDVHNREGAMGQSALESVVSGINYLSKYSWLDTTKIGIQGHSFGGYETDYILTHTHQFAAAMESAGDCDMISAYGSLVVGGESNQEIFEMGQYLMHASPWQQQDSYLQNSAVLLANEVTTPLLMMHNKQDDLVPWQQGVEFFTALRRNGKKAWMLQYDNGRHVVLLGPDAKDYTIRLEQFFNHYLKGAPPPLWMTEGIPARKKGVEYGYELDTSGKEP